MEFTYKAYESLVRCLRKEDYCFCRYDNVYDQDRTVIMRHDIDLSLDKAVHMAELEHRLGIASTYFVLLATSFYNVSSREAYHKVRRIIALGHEVGLHFDEERYQVHTAEDIRDCIMQEVEILSNVLDHRVSVMSMHRPSRKALESDLQLPNVINSYASSFFNQMKYVSDSRMHWREDVFGIIQRNEINRLHILTHPFWYSSDEETMETKLRRFLHQATVERYNDLDSNFRNLDEVIKKESLYAY